MRIAFLLLIFCLPDPVASAEKGSDLAKLIECSTEFRYGRMDIVRGKVLVTFTDNVVTVFTENTVKQVPKQESDFILEVPLVPYTASKKTVVAAQFYVREGGGSIRSPKLKLKSGEWVDVSSLSSRGGVTILGSDLDESDSEKLPRVSLAQQDKTLWDGGKLNWKATLAYEGQVPTKQTPRFFETPYRSEEQRKNLEACRQITKRLQLPKAEAFFAKTLAESDAESTRMAHLSKQVKLTLKQLPFVKETYFPTKPSTDKGLTTFGYSQKQKDLFPRYHVVEVTIDNNSGSPVPIPRVWGCAQLDMVIRFDPPFKPVPKNFGYGGSCGQPQYLLKPGQQKFVELLGSQSGGALTVRIPTVPETVSAPLQLK